MCATSAGVPKDRVHRKQTQRSETKRCEPLGISSSKKGRHETQILDFFSPMQKLLLETNGKDIFLKTWSARSLNITRCNFFQSSHMGRLPRSSNSWNLYHNSPGPLGTWDRLRECSRFLKVYQCLSLSCEDCCPSATERHCFWCLVITKIIQTRYTPLPKSHSS